MLRWLVHHLRREETATGQEEAGHIAGVGLSLGLGRVWLAESEEWAIGNSANYAIAQAMLHGSDPRALHQRGLGSRRRRADDDAPGPSPPSASSAPPNGGGAAAARDRRDGAEGASSCGRIVDIAPPESAVFRCRRGAARGTLEVGLVLGGRGARFEDATETTLRLDGPLCRGVRCDELPHDSEVVRRGTPAAGCPSGTAASPPLLKCATFEGGVTVTATGPPRRVVLQLTPC